MLVTLKIAGGKHYGMELDALPAVDALIQVNASLTGNNVATTVKVTRHEWRLEPAVEVAGEGAILDVVIHTEPV